MDANTLCKRSRLKEEILCCTSLSKRQGSVVGQKEAEFFSGKSSDSWSQGGLRATIPQTRRPYVGLGLSKLDPIRRPRPKEEMG